MAQAEVTVIEPTVTLTLTVREAAALYWTLPTVSEDEDSESIEDMVPDTVKNCLDDPAERVECMRVVGGVEQALRRIAHQVNLNSVDLI